MGFCTRPTMPKMTQKKAGLCSREAPRSNFATKTLMRNENDLAILAATDLSNFLGCAHRTALDLAVTFGAIPSPAALTGSSPAATPRARIGT